MTLSIRKRLHRPPLDSAVSSSLCRASLALESSFCGFFSIVLIRIAGADISHVVREACMSVLKELRGGVGPVSQRHLLKAVSDTVRLTPSFLWTHLSLNTRHVLRAGSFHSSWQRRFLPPV
jgi:SpoVK/Ycf46/Vps4 family AAA+-type ATPase